MGIILKKPHTITPIQKLFVKFTTAICILIVALTIAVIILILTK